MDSSVYNLILIPYFSEMDKSLQKLPKLYAQTNQSQFGKSLEQVALVKQKFFQLELSSEKDFGCSCS